MATAMLYPEPAKLKRDGSSFVAKDLATGLISKARTVLRESPSDAQAVLGGASLDDAYTQVKNRQAVRENDARRLAELRATDADLAARVGSARTVSLP